MQIKEMTLCRVKLEWVGGFITNGKGITVYGPNHECYIAIEDENGKNPNQRQKAAQLALEDVVGPPEYQEKVGAKVVSVEILGLVRVEEEFSFPFSFLPSPLRIAKGEFDCPSPNCSGKMVACQRNPVGFVCQECGSISIPDLIKQGIYLPPKV